MNALQSIPTADHGSLFVTMNPPFEPDESKVIARHKYDHAVVDVEVCPHSFPLQGNIRLTAENQSVMAQRQMHTIQNKRGISFAGAWLGYTFHEDGFTSGLQAALHVSGKHTFCFHLQLPPTLIP